MANLQGLEIAIRRQLDRTFNNITQTEHTFLAMLMGLDAFYKRKGSAKSFRTAPLDVSELQINYEKGLPSSRFFDGTNPDLEAHRLPLRRGYTVEGGTIVPAACSFGPEGILKYEVNRLQGDPALVGWVKKVANACKLSVENAVQAKMFPTQQLAPTTAGGVDGSPRKDQIAALGHFLQAGGAGNVAGVSGTDHLYVYGFDFNLTANQGMRAVNAGTNATPFGNPTPSNIRTKILMPSRKQGGRPDLWVMGANAYNFMISTAEDAVRLTNMITMEFGGEYASFPNSNILLEHNLTDLATNTGIEEAYFLDSREVLFGTQGGFEGSGGVTIIYDVEGAPDLWVLQGYSEWIFFIRNPRRCAHAYYITT